MYEKKTVKGMVHSNECGIIIIKKYLYCIYVKTVKNNE